MHTKFTFYASSIEESAGSSLINLHIPCKKWGSCSGADVVGFQDLILISCDNILSIILLIIHCSILNITKVLCPFILLIYSKIQNIMNVLCIIMILQNANI